MAHCVFHVDLGIELNLTLPDLGHPQLPGLWQQLRAMKWRPGMLQCPQCRDNDPDCPEWMYLQERAGGRRVAVHNNPRVGDHHGVESDTHKAIKERIASAAQRGGYVAELESRAEHGKRRTDVLIRAADGFLLGCEAQISYATAAAVRKRTTIARHDGITSLWTTNDRKAQLIDQAPWARVDRMPWQHIANGAELPVRGGIRALRLERCADRPTVCPDRKHGRCQRWHASWAPREMRLDDLIVRAAGQEYQPVNVPTTRGSGHWFWVSAADKATYLSSLAEPDGSEQVAARSRRPQSPTTPKPINRTCAYGQDAGIRAEVAPARDTGAVVDAPTVTAAHLAVPRQGDVSDHGGDARTMRPVAGAQLPSARVTTGAGCVPNDGPRAAGLQLTRVVEPFALSEWLATRPSCGHLWPAELDQDCTCQCCGLEYGEYTA